MRAPLLALLLAACSSPAEEAPAFTPPHAGYDAVPASALCVTSGAVETLGPRALRVEAAGMRGVLSSDASSAVELAFRYTGASRSDAALANGELRRQIGLKLRAQDSCNVVYVMWHVEPTSGIFVSVKRNPGQSTHAECMDQGYQNLTPAEKHPVPAIHEGERHTLRAVVEGNVLSVFADDTLAWKSTLPAQAFDFEGPAGVRSDNGGFDFELRVPGGANRDAACSGRAAQPD
jgi:hypothetical protein